MFLFPKYICKRMTFFQGADSGMIRKQPAFDFSEKILFMKQVIKNGE